MGERHKASRPRGPIKGSFAEAQTQLPILEQFRVISALRKNPSLRDVLVEVGPERECTTGGKGLLRTPPRPLMPKAP